MNRKFLKDLNAQTSAELILILGGIICIVLIAMFLYKNYLNDFTDKINSNEINNFNNRVNDIIECLN